MSEMQKVTTEELQELNNIQQRSKLLVQELGEISLQKLMLDERQEAAERFLKETRQLETELSTKLEQTYGRVNINTETGEIRPLS